MTMTMTDLLTQVKVKNHAFLLKCPMDLYQQVDYICKKHGITVTSFILQSLQDSLNKLKEGK